MGRLRLTACAALEAEASGSTLHAVRSSARTSVGSHSMSSMFQSWRGAPYSKGGSPIVRVRLVVTWPSNNCSVNRLPFPPPEDQGPKGRLSSCLTQP